MLIYAIPTDPVVAVDELAALYARVFAEPPYWEGPEQVREFVTHYTRDAAKPGFAVVTAHEEETLVGFAYGAARPPGGWWSGCDTPPPPAINHDSSFAIYEWAVDHQYRRRGIGRELLARLLADRPEPWATLTVVPAADAYQFYLRAGWQQVGISYCENSPPMAVLIRRMP
jgi:ribosomal protein S18 acetylase RimI-like enzyme